jgi:hypothetical protein
MCVQLRERFTVVNAFASLNDYPVSDQRTLLLEGREIVHISLLRLVQSQLCKNPSARSIAVCKP